ncbi:putative disease resistance protein RGA4 [Glycine soja]
MEMIRFEDACGDFLSLLDDELVLFSDPIIKQGADELSRALQMIMKIILERGGELTHEFLCLRQTVMELGCSLKPKENFFLRRIRRLRVPWVHNVDKVREIFNGVRTMMADVPEIRSSVSRIQARPVDQVQVQVYGREEDKENIVEFLCSRARASLFLSIYPIVGQSGIGKTTLAQLVYGDQRVRSHFDQRIWISLSGNFSVKKTLCSIIESLACEKYDLYDLDVIERKVRDLLQWKRYLLVLDDIASIHYELSEFISIFPRGSKGSCVLVTTHNWQVAHAIGTFNPYLLPLLDENHCWLMFKQYAFGPDDEEPEALLPLCQTIIEKCRGLPLAAQALGDLMRSKSGVDEWRDVIESWSLHSAHKLDDPAWTSLSLRYSNLSRRSRLCFTFCAIFPPNTEIIKNDLIHLWMANEFISSGENLEAEEVGDITWNELYQKSFFTDVKTDDYSGDISFKMLGPVQQFAEFVSRGKCVILDNNKMSNLSTQTFHAGFGSDLSSFNEGALQKAENLKTLYQLEFSLCNTISGCFPTNHSLRVLRTSYFKLSSLGNLIHLRHLELYGFKIEKLPNSIYSLKKLETLKLTSCRTLMCLPKYLTRLQNLRHLVISECHSLSCMSPNMRNLSCLRTLSLFIVSSKTGHKLEEIGGLNLGGKLRIEGLKNVARLSEAEGANLMGKTNLHELCLSWDNSGEPKSNSTAIANEVLEALQPPPHLKTLRIYDYEGSCLPSWIQKLESLVALELFDCKMCEQLPQLGKLPSLRKLEIFSMDHVKFLDDDESSDDANVSFPSLEQLEVRGLPDLQQLLKVERKKMFPLLSNVTIDDCSNLRFPSLPSIKQLNIRACNYDLLQSISGFSGLTKLNLSGGKDLTSFPPGMVTNLICLKTMALCYFPKLKALPFDIINLKALERMEIKWCSELESLPNTIWEGLCSLQYLEIAYCEKLGSLPKGAGEVESLEVLRIEGCPELEKKCKEGIGEDWVKKAHIAKVMMLESCLFDYASNGWLAWDVRKKIPSVSVKEVSYPMVPSKKENE